MKNLPIIDAHQHFWDLSLKKNPWLDKNNQIPFRYGDYSSICKNFLLADYKKVSKIDVEKNKVFFANKKIDYDAIFVCTGSKSEIVKNIFGDRFIESKTNDIAFTSIVNHNLNIDNAKQFFLKEGPMAILPLNKNKFSFVWSVSDKFKNQNPTPLVTKKLKEILKLKSNFAISKIDCFPISFKFRSNFIIYKKQIIIDF